MKLAEISANRVSKYSASSNHRDKFWQHTVRAERKQGIFIAFLPHMTQKLTDFTKKCGKLMFSCHSSMNPRSAAWKVSHQVFANFQRASWRIVSLWRLTCAKESDVRWPAALVAWQEATRSRHSGWPSPHVFSTIYTWLRLLPNASCFRSSFSIQSVTTNFLVVSSIQKQPGIGDTCFGEVLAIWPFSTSTISCQPSFTPIACCSPLVDELLGGGDDPKPNKLAEEYDDALCIFSCRLHRTSTVTDLVVKTCHCAIGVSFQIFCCSRTSVMNLLVNKTSISAGGRYLQLASQRYKATQTGVLLYCWGVSRYV